MAPKHDYVLFLFRSEFRFSETTAMTNICMILQTLGNLLRTLYIYTFTFGINGLPVLIQAF